MDLFTELPKPINRADAAALAAWFRTENDEGRPIPLEGRMRAAIDAAKAGAA